MVNPKSKKVVVYEDRTTGNLNIRATKTTSDPKGFAIKSYVYGKTLPKSASDEDLGKTVREILKKCD